MNKTRTTKVLVFVLLVCVMAVLALPGFAQDAPNGRGGRLAPNIYAVGNSENGIEAYPGVVKMADGRIQVMVQLSAAPAVEAFLEAGGRANRAIADVAAAAQANAVDAAQSSFVSAAAGIGATRISSTNYLTNTVTVAVSPGAVDALRAMPGVVGVFPNRILYRTDTTSTQFIGAPKAWDPAVLGGAFTGTGTVIAIIDSGIDYIHTDFGGTGDYGDNPDDEIITDTVGLFPATFPVVAVGDPKVVGGTDYVGDAYDAATPGLDTPDPDPDPIDCAIDLGGGHGSHVAGSAAGWGVNADGSTYEGPFEEGIFTAFPDVTTAFRIGPGVAPEAALLALRVFGCDGSTSSAVVTEAIDDAVSGALGHVADVINMSLGSPYGDQAVDAPYNAAITAASEAGTIVVMSAGNNGDNFFVTGAPGTANSGISVASITDTTNSARAIQQDNPAPVLHAAAYGAASPYVHPNLTAEGLVPTPSTGCAIGDFTGFTGKIAVIDRGTCNFVVKTNNAFAAGAVGVIVVNNQGDGLITMAADGATPGYDLPTVFIGQTDGTNLKANLGSITFDASLLKAVAETPNDVSSFTSRGPDGNKTGSFKPDIAAPGNTITSAGSGTGNIAYNISGTSMASPHMAGVMALLRQKYPDWSVADLKALAMNTSNASSTKNALNAKYGPQRVGAGRVNIPNALKSKVIAFNKDNPEGVSVSFGFPEVLTGDSLNLKQKVTVVNTGNKAVQFSTGIITRSNMPGVKFDVSPNVINVPAGGQKAVTVSLTGSPFGPQVYANSDPTHVLTADAYFFAEESGFLELDAKTGTSLVVPLYAAPRPASEVEAKVESINVSGLVGEAGIPLKGQGVNTGNQYPNDILSVVSAFELVATDVDDEDVEDSGDVQYLGVAGNAWMGNIYFAFATYGEWQSFAETQIQVGIDSDQDSNADWILLKYFGNFDEGEICVVDVNDVIGAGAGALFCGFGAYLNDTPPDIANTYVFNNNVMVYSFPIWILDAEAGEPDTVFNFSVLQDSFDSTDTVEIGPFTYDWNNPTIGQVGFDNTSMPLSVDKNNGSADFSYSFDAPGEYPLLLLHHHNGGAENRAEVVTLNVLDEGNFNLVGPADGSFFRDSQDAFFTWEDYGADTYTLALFQISGNALASANGERLGFQEIVYTRAAFDGDALNCIAGTCELNTTGLELPTGTWTWTVVSGGTPAPLALDGALVDDDVEASNGPWGFTIDISPVALLKNGGFENDNNNDNIPDGWKRVGAGAQTCKPGDADTGDCAYFVKGSGNGSLIQNVKKALLKNLAIDDSDTLTLEARVKTKNLAEGAMLRVTLKYAGDPDVENFDVPLPADTADLYTDLAVPLVMANGMRGGDQPNDVAILPDGTITKATVKIVYKGSGNNSRLYIDGVSLTLDGIPVGPLTTEGGQVPVPAAPADLRGNN